MQGLFRSYAPRRGARDWTPSARWLGALLCSLAALSACTDEGAKGGGEQGDGQSVDAPAQDSGASDTAVLAGDTHDGAGAPGGDAAPSDAATDGGAVDVAPRCTSHDACPDPGKPCLRGVCDPVVGCVVKPLPDDAICGDGDPCTPVDHCAKGVCVAGEAKVCAAKGPCVAAACDPKIGVCVTTPLADGTACDDGEACTTGDTCQKGACTAGKLTCTCLSDADCSDDGNVCNGTPYCDAQASPPVCKLNPASVVTCSATGDVCQPNVCDPKTGACGLVSATKGTPCDDGDKCTVGDACDGGTCKAGVKTCCSSNADCAGLEDGDACNGTLYCDTKKGTCVLNPATVVHCPTAWDTACATTGCDKASGKCVVTHTAVGSPCDADSSACTPTDFCDNGACLAGTSVCDCQVDADCVVKDDTNPCTGKHYCDKSGGAPKCVINPATVPECSAGQDTACLRNTCDPNTGGCTFVALPDGVTCDADGTACTPKDTCFAGQCRPDDAVVCPCQSDSDCAGQEDGDLCNGTLYCDPFANVCKVNPKTVVRCASVDDTTCRVNQCQPKTGQCAMVAVHQNKRCDADGNPCTPDDRCDKGACVASKNVCPCQQDAACAPWQDNDLCNGTLYCDKSDFHCRPLAKTVVTCSPWQDDDCARSTCDPKTGKCAMKPVRQLGSCDADGNPCTLYDTCDKGTCVAGANVCGCGLDSHCGPFQDKDACNGTLFCDKGLKPFGCAPIPSTVVTCKTAPGCIVPVCQPGSGQCAPGPARDGKPCDDGDLCSKGDACAKGACAGAAVTCAEGGACVTVTCDAKSGLCSPKAKLCDDGNPCTQDPPCSLPGGCSPTALPDGTTCTDADPCTLKTACTSGLCAAVGDTCDDDDPCTADACGAGKDGKQACAHTAASGGLCDDGFACTVADTCTKGTCAGQVQSCDDGNACTTDACDADTGKCVATATVAPCTDGSACTKEDVCVAGTCKGVKISCDDGQPCTADTCVAATGCVHKAGPDGLPCAFGACWFQGACKAGKCSSEQERLWLREFQPAVASSLRAAVDGGGDTVVVAGYQAGSKHNGAKPWIMRLDAHGKALWNVLETYGGRFGGLAAVKDGGFVAAGNYMSGGLTRPLLVKYDSVGKEKWKHQWAEMSRGGWTRVRALTDGGVAVVGDAAVLTGVRDALWARFDAAGKQVWAISPSTDLSLNMRNLVTHGDAVLTALENFNDPWIALEQRAGDGKRLWHRRYDEVSKAEPYALARGPKGGFVVGGESASAQGAYVLRVDATGRLLWRRVLPLLGKTNAYAGVYAARFTSAGQIQLFTSRHTVGGSSLLQLLDPDGTLVHEHTVDSGKAWLVSPVSLPKGQLLLVGHRPEAPSNGQAIALAARISAWGHATCKAAGACFGQTAASCDDGKRCTQDTCAAVGGCSHEPMTTGQLCEDGLPCTLTSACSKDGCTAGPARLTPWPAESAETAWHDVRGSVRNGSWVVGRTKVNGAWTATASRRLPGGTVAKTWVAAADGPTQLNAVDVDGTFNIYAVGSSAKGPWFGSLFNYSMDLRWQLKATSGKSATLLDVVVRPRSGRILAVGHASKPSGIPYGWLVLANTKGQQLWSKDLVKNLETRRLSCGVTSEEDFLVAGYEQLKLYSGSNRAWVTRVDVSGNQVWAKQLSLDGSPNVKYVGGMAAVRDAKGGAVLGGGSLTATGKAWFARIDNEGKVLWSHVLAYDKTFANRVRAALWRPDGAAVAVLETGYGNLRTRVALFDAALGTQRSVVALPDAVGAETTRGASLTAYDDLLIAGWRTSSGKPLTAQLRRTSPHGHTTCEAAGICADAPAVTDLSKCVPAKP